MFRKNFWENVYDFFGSGTFTATASDNAPMLIKDTSAAGTPTFAYATPSASGELAIAFDNTNEVQNVCLFQNDILQYDIDDIIEVRFRVKMNQATVNAATSLAFGLASARNDAIDTIAEAAIFRVVGADSVSIRARINQYVSPRRDREVDGAEDVLRVAFSSDPDAVIDATGEALGGVESPQRGDVIWRSGRGDGEDIRYAFTGRRFDCTDHKWELEFSREELQRVGMR